VTAIAHRIALLGALGLTAGCGGAPAGTGTGAAAGASGKPATAAGLVVKRGVLEDRFALTGELEAVTSENLVVPRTPIWLLSIRWLADEGVLVKKGDPVIEFDSSSFAGTLEDKRLAMIRTGSELAGEVAKATADDADKSLEVDRKRADLAKAEAEASVPADLYPRRVHQEKQLELARKRDALTKAEADLAAHRKAARLERTVKDVAYTRAERELTDLRARLEELTVRAPRDGLVQIGLTRRENRKFLVGDQGCPGWTVASLPDLTAMQVRARRADVDDGAVRVGMPADCILDAYPGKVWKGMVKQVSPMARAEGRDTTRRFFDVLVELEVSDAKIMRPGMSMRVEVTRRRAEQALIIPRVAVKGAPGKAQLRLADGKIQEVQVDWCTELACVVRGEVREGSSLLAAAAEGKGAS
jgi:multidrug efflux pump subunit AcrA (membrane-fusion protein)